MDALACSQYPLCTFILAAVDIILGAFQKHLDILHPVTEEELMVAKLESVVKSRFNFL